MKEVVYILVGLVLLASANAELTQQPRAVFNALEISCDDSGTLHLNTTHTGINVFTKDIKITAVHLDSNSTFELSQKGIWTTGYDGLSEINQTGTDFYGASSTARFISDPVLTGVGEYQLIVSWPGGIQEWQTRVVKAFRCPGISCKTEAQCDGSQTCSEGKCSQLSCSGCDIAMNHKCRSKCDDDNACTTDACDEHGNCLHAAAKECCRSDSQCNDGNNCTVDRCSGGKCSNQAVKCPKTVDPCAVGECVEGGNCVYTTDSKCQQRMKSVLFRIIYWFKGAFS